MATPDTSFDSTREGTGSGRGTTWRAVQATAGGVLVVAVAFGLWRVRTMIILLLLALTFAAAVRPGVDWLRRRRVPESVAILVFFVVGLGVVFLFFWLALPPLIHQVTEALHAKGINGTLISRTTGFRHDVLVWINDHLKRLPSGDAVLHPVAAYGKKATNAIVGVLFTLAATWYWISERDRVVELLTALSPERKREKARETYLLIDRRLGVYTRVKFLMVFAIGAVLSVGFYLVGLNYWLLLGGLVSLLEIIPIVGPAIAAVIVLVVGLSQSVHTAVFGLLVVVVVREFQSYVVNPHLSRYTVGLSPLVTLISVSAVGLLFGAFAVVLAIPVVSAVSTLIEVFVLDRELPAQNPPRRRFPRRREAPG
jgi:predicted PurR-regulated permease PerM